MSSRLSKLKLRPIDPEFWTVENELPDPIPVSKAELDAIERYFGELLDHVHLGIEGRLSWGVTDAGRSISQRIRKGAL